MHCEAPSMSESWSSAPTFFQFINRYSSWHLVVFITILFDICVNLSIIHFIPFTDIDWTAYMQEVGKPSGFLGGVKDYLLMKGDTGPLVYPAGFVYIYSLLYKVTNEGSNIKLAQYLFTILSAFTIYTLSHILRLSKRFPPLALLLVTASLRIHSIWVLRLFNDGPMVLISLLAVLAAAKHRHFAASILFSLAISIKMSALLYLPGFLLIVAIEMGSVFKLIPHVFNIISIQFLLGIPFLKENFSGYLIKSFEFSRVFTYKWTVNWKFLSSELFLNENFGKMLLIGHLLTLIFFLFFKWSGIKTFKLLFGTNGTLQSSNAIVSVLVQSNLIGVIFARSLHYQFYSWYFYTLFWILFSQPLPKRFITCCFTVALKVSLLFLIDFCWVIYPSTEISSLILQSCHILLLIYMIFSKSAVLTI
ncbi:hypothetical protein P9112_008293 [Eukaryota sp. TZLM1-RC]